MDSIAAVICAAGNSARMGGTKKEYRLLPGADGLTVLGASVSAFAKIPEIKTIVIAIPADSGEGERCKRIKNFTTENTEEEEEAIKTPCCPTGQTAEDAARNALPSRFFDTKNSPTIFFVSGGATRQTSVFNALSFLASQCAPDLVLIHDGARPWVSPDLIRRVIAGVEKYRAVVPLLPLTETPKEVDREWGVGRQMKTQRQAVSLDLNQHVESPNDGHCYLKGKFALANLEGDGEWGEAVFIKRHLKRALVGAAQTPQGFSFPEIFAAHQQAAAHDTHHEYTDDAEVWAAFCGPVAAIPGENENRKITFPEDLC